MAKGTKGKHEIELIKEPKRAATVVSNTDMPDRCTAGVVRSRRSDENLVMAWLRAKHGQMISFNPTAAFEIKHAAPRPYFRGSGLPVCPLRTALDSVRKVPRQDTRHLLSDFYTETGHVIHEALQFWFGKAGLLFGKFQCPVCRRLYPKHSTPDDAHGMLGPVMCRGTKKHPHNPTYANYVEFHINNLEKTGAFDGHCDGVLFINGMYLVLEIKTTSTVRVRSHEAGPDHKHMLQATGYRYMLPKFLNIPDKKWYPFTVIVYYDRANPKVHTPLIVPYNPDVFVEQIRTFIKTAQRIKARRFDKITGICESCQDDTYCPYNSMCFSMDAQRLISEILPGYTHISWAPIPSTTRSSTYSPPVKHAPAQHAASSKSAMQIIKKRSHSQQHIKV